jgi:uncharacterized membrane protein YoaK (UPF0700 family)
MAESSAPSSSGGEQPQPLDKNLRPELILLSLAAGGADAAGYLGLGKIFTANMTGNIVLLGMALGESRQEATGRAAFALAAFMVGACWGGWMCSRIAGRNAESPWITATLACEGIMLMLFAVLWSVLPATQSVASYVMLAVLSSAMGLQAAAVYGTGVPSLPTVVVTTTMTSLMSGIPKALSRASTLGVAIPDPLSSFRLKAREIVSCRGVG